MGGMAFADDGADLLKRNAAWVPSRSSKSEFIDEDEGEGAELSGRLSLRDAGKGHGDEDAETWDWEQGANSSSKSCTVFFTGLLRLTIGVPLPERPSDAAVISGVMREQSIGQVPVFSNEFHQQKNLNFGNSGVMFSWVKV